MSTNKTFNKVQLDVKFTQATSRVNLISEENISISFGKISKYFADLHSQAFTGYTHPTYTARTGKPTGNQTPGFGSTFTISQITSDGTGHVTAATDRTVKIPDTTMGAASADAAGSKGLVPAPAAGKQTSFLRGDGTWAIPTNTDTKVTQSQTTTTNYRPILFGANNSTDVSTLANTITDQAYTSTKMYAQPSTGLIFCTGRKIENVTIQTGSTKQAHITLQTLMTWLITTKTYIPSGQYCHVIISTTWVYENNDILQVSIDGTNYEIQLAGVIIEFIGGATSYNAGMFRLLIHSSPTINFTATSGYSKFPVSTIAEYTCNGSDYSPTWKKIWNSHPTYTSKSSGLYKITVDGTGHVSAATAVAKADITALGIPGSDTNTTYTIATGDNDGQIKVTPSGGTAYNVSVKGLGSAAYTESSAYATSSHTHGLSHSNLNQMATNGTTGGWSVIGIDPAVAAFVLKSIRINQTSPNWLCGNYGAGIAFGGADTKGVISMQYGSPVITFAGGNHASSKTEPVWYLKISGTSGSTYNFDNFYNTTTSQTANTVLAAPNGSNGAATFRKLVATDIPSLNYIGAKSDGTYYGMANPAGADNVWIRTTSLGIIPYQSGNAGSGHGSLGTSSWYFSSAYIDNIYGSLNGTAAQAVKLRSSAARTDSSVDTANTTPYQKYWVKIASCFTTGNYTDLESLWAVNDVYGNRQGILKVRARVEGTAGTFGNTRTIRWLVADNSIDVNMFAIVCYNNRKPDGTEATGTATVELWWKSTGQYASFSFVLLDETRRTGKQPNDWTLYDTSTYGQAALPTTGNITYSVAATILNSTTGNAATATKATTIATEVGSSAGARPVFYGYLGDNTRVVYNTNFTYNPSGNVLTATTFAGALSGNATSANKLNTNAGATYRPVYFSGGVPVQCDAPESGSFFKGVPSIGTDGVMEIGKIIDFHSTNTSTADYDVRIDVSDTSQMTLISNSGKPRFKIKGTEPILNFAQTTTGKAYDSSYTGIIAYPGDTSGLALVMQSGGMTVIASGESGSNGYPRLISTSTSDTDKKRNPYLASGFISTAWSGASGVLILSSDNAIYFQTNMPNSDTVPTDWDNLKTICIDSSGNFKPTVNKKGQLGTSSLMWNAIYGNTIYENGTSLANKYAAKSHTHSYLPLAGGTMDDNSTIVIPGVDNARSSTLTCNGTQLKVSTSSNWAMGLIYYNSASTSTSVGFIGAYGTTDAFESIRFGAKYDNWWMKITGTETTITGDLGFSTVTSTTYPAESKKIKFGGGTDWGRIYYRVDAADAGRLVLDIGDDSNARIDFAYNGTTKSHIDTSGNFSGNAATSSSWATARTLTLSGQLTGSVSVKGDANMTLSGWLKKSFIYDETSDFASYAWHKFAEKTITNPNEDQTITFIVSKTWGDVPRCSGILTAHIRTGSTKVYDSSQFYWQLANSEIDPEDFVFVYTNTANTSCKVELWYKQSNRWDGWVFSVLKEHSRTSNNNVWTLYTSTGHGSASHTTGTASYASSIAGIQNNTSGTSSNVTGTVAIANGGTGATTRLAALKALTNEGVGTNAQYFLTITQDWGKGGYTSVADAKTVLGLGTAAYKASSDFAVNQTLANDTNLNNITTPGFYNCGGPNSVTNKPSNVYAFGLNVIHDAFGQWYTQILYPNNASPLIYVRNYNGSAWSGWNSIAIGSFLPLSGGTMTGTLTAKASQYADEYGGALNMNNSNIYGVNAIYTADVSDNAAEGIHFYRDSTHVDTLWMNGGSLLFVPNRELGTSTTAANSQKVARFTANPTSGQVVITDGTTGGIKSSGYTIATSVPSGAVFTDQKVRQSATTSEDFRPILMGATHVSGSSTGLDATVTDEAYVSTKLYCQPKTGNLYVAGDIKRVSNTLSLWSWNDCAGVSQRNNCDINTWYGFSVSNACTNAGTLNKVAFSVNARNGQAWHTGNVHLYSASGDSPALVFQRGTFVDNLNDWKIYVSGGALYFAQSTANASSETWTNKMYFHASDGNLYVGSTKVSLEGHTHNYAGSSSAGGAATWATLLKAISTTTTASASTWNIPSGSYQVWGEKFSDTRLKYTPSGGTAQQITDTGDLVMWLTGNATANQATLNMRIDGTYYGSFSGNITGNVTGNVNGKLYHTGTGSAWWDDRDNAVIRITTGDTQYRPLWTLLTATSGSWGMGNHTGDDLTFNFISKAVYDSKKNPSTYAQIKFTNAGGITATGSITANKFYGDITGDGLNAGIYDLLNTDNPIFNGAEWMLTSIPSSSGGTSTPSFRRVKTAKFADYVSSTSRTVLFDQSDNTSTSISLSTPPTDTQYLKLYFKSSGNNGQPAVDNSVYSIAEVPYMTDVNLGGILQVAQSSDNQGILRLTALAFNVKITTGNPYTLRLIKVSKASRISGSGVSDDSSLSANIIKVVAYR